MYISDEDLALYSTLMQEIYDRNHGGGEQAHAEADDLLCELLVDLGCNQVVEIFKKLNKWYS